MEVKLKEALHRSGRKPPEETGKPDDLRIAICMHMLSELAELSGPFHAALAIIRREVACGLFSDYFEADHGATAFEQKPFFAVIDHLEREVEAMEREREEWRADVQQWHQLMNTVGEEVQKLRERVAEKERERDSFSNELQRMQERVAKSQREVEESNDDLRRARRDVARAREESQHARQAALAVVPDAGEEAERLKRQCVELQRTLSECQAELKRYKEEREHLVPKSQLENVEEEARDLRLRLEANASKEATSGYLTPRPDWGAIDDRGFTKGASKTRDKAAALAKSAKALQSDYTELQKVKAELSAQMDETIELISGERGPLRVNVNELLRDAGGGSAMLTLGTHAEVPRYLRWSGRLPVYTMSKEEVDRLAWDIWEAKLMDDDKRSHPLPLHSFLYDFFKERASSQNEVAEMGYNLHYALHNYSYDTELSLLKRILDGTLPEETKKDQIQMVKALEKALLLHEAKQHPGWIFSDDLWRLLDDLFPRKRPDRLEKLKTATLKEQRARLVYYPALLRSDSERGRPLFLDEAMQQHAEEVEQFSDQVSLFIDNAMNEHEPDPVPLSALRLCIANADKGMTAEEVDDLTARGCGFPSRSLVQPLCNIGTSEPCFDAQTFARRLHRGLLRPARLYSFPQGPSTVCEDGEEETAPTLAATGQGELPGEVEGAAVDVGGNSTLERPSLM